MSKQQEMELISVDTLKTDAQTDEPRKPVQWIRIRMILGLPYPEPSLFCTDLDPSRSTEEKSRILIHSRIRIRLRMSVDLYQNITEPQHLRKHWQCREKSSLLTYGK